MILPAVNSDHTSVSRYPHPYFHVKLEAKRTQVTHIYCDIVEKPGLYQNCQHESKVDHSSIGSSPTGELYRVSSPPDFSVAHDSSSRWVRLISVQRLRSSTPTAPLISDCCFVLDLLRMILMGVSQQIEALPAADFLNPLHSFTNGVAPGFQPRGLDEKPFRLEARRRIAGKMVQENQMADTICR